MEGINNHIIDYKTIQKKFTFDHRLAKRILKQYFDEKPKVEPLFGGFRNSSALITTKDDKYVMRIYSDNPKHTKSGIKAEWDFINYFYNNEIPVPQLILNKKDNWLSKEEAKYSILMNFIEGTDGRYNLNDQKFRNLGTIMARMHSLSKRFTPQNKRLTDTQNQFDQLKNKITPNDAELYARFNDFYKRYKEMQTTIENSPKYFIHGDLIFSNIIFKGNKVNGILDFDGMDKNLVIKEVAVFVISVYDHHNLYAVKQSNIDEFLKAYTTLLPFTNKDKKLFPLYLECSQLGISRMIKKYRPELSEKFANETKHIIDFISNKYL